MKKRVEDK